MFARIAQYRLDQRLRAAYERYQHVLVPSLLLFGFLVDVATFQSLRLKTSFLLLGIYATVATIAIAYVARYDAAKERSLKGAFFSYLRFLSPLALQFSLGALLSASLLFYWFSGALSASWPIMILLAILSASNEVFRDFFLRPTVQIGVYAFVLLSYASMLFSFLFRSLSPETFLMGILCGTVIATTLAATAIGPSGSRKSERHKRIGTVLAVSSTFIALYFLNVIPPVPLAIHEAGIFHDVQRFGDAYVLVGDEETFLGRLLPGRTIANDADGRVYAYAAIFAPAELDTVIFHRWQRLDPSARTWVTTGRPSYVIRGGREEGYRGYTYKTGLAPGEWRVIVETERGQELGRIPFTVTN